MAADSEHIVGELMKGFTRRRSIPKSEVQRLTQVDATRGAAIGARLQGVLPAIALTSQISLTSAVANDIAYDRAFAQQVYGLGKPGDAFFGISTSGNSENVINAGVVAKAQGLHTVALTGRNGGRRAEVADVCVKGPPTTSLKFKSFISPLTMHGTSGRMRFFLAA